MNRIESRQVDKSGWPDGPWQDEPDRIQWPDQNTGLPCLIIRHPRRGYLCGYVAVMPGHPLHGCTADEVGPLAVHWEISHAGPPGNDEMAVPGLEDPWWFGFFCGHHEDIAPADPETAEFGGAEYRTTGYVAVVCAILAVQLAHIATVHAERVAKAAFVCPRCGTPSAALEDAVNGYCGKCHDYTAPLGM